jgi:hypothetical protein
MAGFKFTGLAAGSSNGDSVRFEQVQPIDPQLTALAGVSPVAGDIFYWTAATTLSAIASTAAGRSVLTFVDPNADRVIGWDDSAGSMIGFTLGAGLAFNATAIELDATLAAIAGVTVAAGSVLVASGADVFFAQASTAQGRAFWNYADPNADRIIFWDDSAGALTNLALGTGLAFNDTTLELDADLVAIAALATQAAGRSVLTLADPNADRLVFWDDSAGAMAFLTAGTGLVISTTTITVDIATAAEFRANTADQILDTDGVWSAAETVTLTDAATIAVDMSAFINATVTLGGNRTLGQPSNTKVGQSGFIRINQDATGNRTLAYHADWKFDGGSDPTLSTAASATDVLYYSVIAANFIHATLRKALA